MADYTPGEWTVARDRHDHWGMVEVLGPGVSGSLTIGFLIATDVDAKQAAQVLADAHLISAAKNLLEAVENYLYGRKEARECEAEMRAAVAKAKGVPHG